MNPELRSLSDWLAVEQEREGEIMNKLKKLLPLLTSRGAIYRSLTKVFSLSCQDQ